LDRFKIVNLVRYLNQGLFRFSLAMLVFVSHTIGLPGFYVEVLAPFQIGNASVLLFFVVSGFLMTSSLENSYSNGRFKEFFINRSLRIYPQLSLAIVISLCCHVFVISIADLGKLVTIIPDLKNIENLDYLSYLWFAITVWFFPLNDKIMQILGEKNPFAIYEAVRYLWAIYVELLFYFLIALYFYLRNVSARYFVYFYNLILFTLVLASYTFVVDSSLLPPLVEDIFALRLPILQSFIFAPFFILGHKLYYRFESNNYWVTSQVFVFAFLSILILYVKYSVNTWQPLFFFALLILIFYRILCVHYSSDKLTNPRSRPKLPFKSFSRKVDDLFGGMSYPIYLNHYALTVLVLAVWDALGLPRNMGIIFFVLCLLLLALGHALSRLDTLAFGQLRNKIRGIRL
jgi:peptidoglycan/LPS O-acetylase OafA/YrhL